MFISEWREFPSAPCLAGKSLMTTRVSMLLKSRTSRTCFRACFLRGRTKDFSGPRYIATNGRVVKHIVRIRPKELKAFEFTINNEARLVRHFGFTLRDHKLCVSYCGLVKIKQSRYRPGLSQRFPGV